MNIRRSLAKIFRSTLWMFVTCAFASRLSIAGESGETWDHQLPTLNFSAIKIEADSLVGAWQGISRETLLRSILYVREDSPVAGPFKFIKESSTGRELLDSLVAQYPAFKWEQDGSTGVIWILPTNMSLGDILPLRVSVARNYAGLPALTSVMMPLIATSRMRISFERTSAALRNTFDYALDIAAGDYAVRDFFSLACAANPTKTFYIFAADRGAAVTPVNLVSDQMHNLPVGVRRLWQQAGGQDERNLDLKMLTSGLPKLLGQTDSERRRKARWLLEAIIWQLPFGDWMHDIADKHEALWLALALIDVLARDPEATEHDAVKQIQKLATKEFVQKGDVIAVLSVGLELSRLVADDSVLAAFSTRKLSADELAEIRSNWPVFAAMLGRSRKLTERVKQGDNLLQFAAKLQSRGALPPLLIEFGK